jgi:hypothetical protein
VNFCFECKEFPCLRLIKLDEKYKSEYKMSIIENLKLIRAEGIEKFLSLQKIE